MELDLNVLRRVVDCALESKFSMEKLNGEIATTCEYGSIHFDATDFQYGGDNAKGIQILQELINEGEKEYDLYYNIAVAYTEIKEYSIAKENIALALEVNPDEPEANKLKEYIGIVENEDN